ncbi:type II toxin-antitoxin system HicA family toxin [Enterococcus sp. AZ163]|uniref:type II toxin-antitoxin system HicA family toxin n=1 Tax=Enterococcus sp. AZ163 TaxID=2774638 RepID=UPI003D27A315
MPMTGKDLLRLARKNGWQMIRQKVSHVRLKHFETGEKVTIAIHANKDLSKGTEQTLLKLLNLN